MGYLPIHRNIDHSINALRLPFISRDKYELLKSVDFELPPLVNGILIPINETTGEIVPDYEDFKEQKRLINIPLSPYHAVQWANNPTLKKRMPKQVYDYRSSFQGTEMVVKRYWRKKGVLNQKDFFKNLSKENMEFLKNIGGSISFGGDQQRQTLLPFVVVIVVAVALIALFRN